MNQAIFFSIVLISLTLSSVFSSPAFAAGAQCSPDDPELEKKKKNDAALMTCKKEAKEKAKKEAGPQPTGAPTGQKSAAELAAAKFGHAEKLNRLVAKYLDECLKKHASTPNEVCNQDARRQVDQEAQDAGEAADAAQNGRENAERVARENEDPGYDIGQQANDAVQGANNNAAPIANEGNSTPLDAPIENASWTPPSDTGGFEPQGGSTPIGSSGQPIDGGGSGPVQVADSGGPGPIDSGGSRDSDPVQYGGNYAPTTGGSSGLTRVASTPSDRAVAASTPKLADARTLPAAKTTAALKAPEKAVAAGEAKLAIISKCALEGCDDLEKKLDEEEKKLAAEGGESLDGTEEGTEVENPLLVATTDDNIEGGGGGLLDDMGDSLLTTLGLSQKRDKDEEEEEALAAILAPTAEQEEDRAVAEIEKEQDPDKRQTLMIQLEMARKAQAMGLENPRLARLLNLDEIENPEEKDPMLSGGILPGTINEPILATDVMIDTKKKKSVAMAFDLPTMDEPTTLINKTAGKQDLGALVPNLSDERSKYGN